MAARHIAIETWLEALGLVEYVPLFATYTGVEELLYLTEADIRDLGLKNSAHRAKVSSSLRLLREKYERSTLPGKKGGSQTPIHRSYNATAQLTWSPPSAVNSPDYQVVGGSPVSPEQLQQDLLNELQGDPTDLKSKAWYHGSIPRQHAEKLVSKNGDFLVRDCISRPGDFVLTCCWKGGPIHFVINSTVTQQVSYALPKVTYHFEDHHFPSVHDLVQTYMDTCTTITNISGAVITTPIARSMPLSYYDSKYGALTTTQVGGGHYATVNQRNPSAPFRAAAMQSPYGTPTTQSPYGVNISQSPYSSPATYSPYGTPTTQSLYGTPKTQSPYGTPTTQSPYGTPQTQSPYGTPTTQSPYGIASTLHHPVNSSQSPYVPNAPSPSITIASEGKGVPRSQNLYGAPAFTNPYGTSQGPAGVSPRASPHGTPGGSPVGSPHVARSQKVERSGSQPLLSVEPSPVSLPPFDRCDSLPLMTGVRQQSNPNLQGRSSPVTTKAPVCYHQRSGSAPVLTPGVTVTQHFDLLAPPSNINPASSESDLHKPPPPKPSRIPSVKYTGKNRPQVQVRNIDLYEDDSRDYSDYSQVKSEPSWLSHETNQTQGYIPATQKLGQFTSNQRAEENKLYDNNLHPKKSKESYSDVNQNITNVDSRKVSDTRFSILDHDYSDIPPFPVDSTDINTERSRTSTQHYKQTPSPTIQIKIPNMEESKFNLDYQSNLLPDENRILEPAALLSVRKVLLDNKPIDLARYLTSADLDILKVLNEEDLGVFVQSGLELLTLPQGRQLRQDILERMYCVKVFVMVMVVTCQKVVDRAHMLSQWIQVAMETISTTGNLYGFENIMMALKSEQIQRLRDTWMVLRQHHTNSAFLFDTKLKSAFRMLNDGSASLPVQDICIPNITPIVQLMERGIDDSVSFPWETADWNSGLDVMLIHLDMARVVTAQCDLYRTTGQSIVKDLVPDIDKSEMFRTEFYLRFLWGYKGAGVNRTERQNKFNQLLTAYSEKMEPTGDDGTAV